VFGSHLQPSSRPRELYTKVLKPNKTVLAVRMVADVTKIRKGPSIKDVRSQEGGEFVQCGHFADKGGSSDADIRTFFRKKLRIFRNSLGVRTDRVVESV